MVTLLTNILSEHKTKISNVEIIPGVDGIFDVYLNDEFIFSRKKENRMPNELEIENIISDNI